MASIATQSDYEIGQDNVQILGLDIHNPVFVVASLTIIGFVAGVLGFRDAAADLFEGLYVWLTSTFAWVFMGAGNVFVLFCLLLAVTPLGRVRLGGPDAKPEYSVWSWFAMLFAAGIGIGLMFFGVAQPIDHFQNPPLGVDAADTAAAHRLAIASSIFHWGVHPWAMFAVVALALAFAAYNLGLPLTLRSAFYPVLGKAVWGRFGHVIDVLAVFATLFGLATSLGFGAEQTAAGLAHLFGVPATDTTKVLIIAAVTFIAVASVVAGMDRGVKRLSQVNLLLALILLAFVLTVGPTLDLFAAFAASIGHYLAAIGPLSNWVGRDDFEFMHGWTTFFLGLVALLVALRGHVHRPGFSRPHGARTRWLHVGRPGAGVRALDECLRGDRNLALLQRRRDRRVRGGAVPTTRAGSVPDARGAAARWTDLLHCHRPGDRVLRYLV